MTGKAAWSEIADVACLAEAVGLLDADIANSLNVAVVVHSARNTIHIRARCDGSS